MEIMDERYSKLVVERDGEQLAVITDEEVVTAAGVIVRLTPDDSSTVIGALRREE